MTTKPNNSSKEGINPHNMCPNHSKKELACISLVPDSKDCLICLDCLALCAQKDFLPLQSVLDSDSKTIFKSWPVLIDSDFYEQLIEISQKKSYVEKRKQEIKKFFQEFSQNINSILTKKQEKMMKQIDNIWDTNEKVLDEYNSLCEKEKLKNILLNDKESVQNKNQQLSNIISTTLQNQSENKERIVNSIEKFQKKIDAIELVFPKKIKDNIIQKLEAIDLFYINKDRTESQEKINELQIAEMSTSELIIKLIDNKVNNCSEGLLQQLKKAIITTEECLNKTQITGLKNEFVLELDKLQFKQQQNMKQLAKQYLQNQTNRDNFDFFIQFDKLDEGQQNRIEELVKKIYQLTQVDKMDYKNGQFPSKEQSNSQIITTYSSKYLGLSSQKEFSQLLINYPTCELLPKLELLHTPIKLDFIKTQFKDSQKLKIEQNQQGILKVTQTNRLDGQITTENKLDVNTNYVFRCKFSQKLNFEKGYINVGIMKKENRDSKFFYVDNCFLDTCSNKLNETEIGQKLFSVRDNIDYIEVEVNIGKKILLFKDYPYYNNINQTSPNNIDQNGEYVFGLLFVSIEDNITVQIESFIKAADSEANY